MIVRRLFLGAAVVLILAGSGVRLWGGSATPIDPQDVHEWRKRGECRDCHSSQVFPAVVDADGTEHLINPAAYHTSKFRRYTHGRRRDLNPLGCVSCHEKQTCVSCHVLPPESHTPDFVAPTGRTDGTHRHTLLGRIRPSSCLTCHGSFVSECTGCHAPAEVQPWQSAAQDELQRWSSVLDTEG